MAVKKVVIPVQFVDQAASAAKVVSGLSGAIKSISLPPDMHAKVEGLIGKLKDFEIRSKELSGKPIKESTKMSIEAESKRLQKEAREMATSIQEMIRGVEMPEIIKNQITGMEKEIESKEASVSEKLRKIMSLQKIDKQGRGDVGFGNVADIEKLRKKVEEFQEEYKKLRALEATDSLDAAGKAKLQDYADRAAAVDALSFKIEEHTKQINTLNLETEEETRKIEELRVARDNLEKQYGSSNPKVVEAIENLKKTKQGTKEWDDAIKNLVVQLKVQKAESEESNTTVKKFTDNVKDSIKNLFGYAAVFATVKRVVRQSIQVIKDLDKSFTEIAMVTTYTNKEVWKMKDAFNELATSTGLTITEVGKLSVEFFRQGRSLSETMKLVEAAGIAARLAGISTTESVRFLTSAINGYQLAADQAMAVSDKFAALAASSASSYEELATALSKVAAQAYSAGVSMDNMMGFIAKAIETTREAPENIGTAFKTIFARMSELKDFGKTMEDGMDLNRIETALGSVNVKLRDTNGEFRNLDDVLIDVGNQWSGLTKNQKAYITTALAGTRQQTRLLAVFENFDRTMELVNISSNSLGASYAQQQKYYESIEYAVTKMTNSWQDFITTIISSDIVKTIVNLGGMFTKLLNTIAGNKVGQFVIVTGLAVVGLRALTGVVKELRKEKDGYFASVMKSIGATGADTTAALGNMSATILQKMAKYGLATATTVAEKTTYKLVAAQAIATAGVSALVAVIGVLVYKIGESVVKTHKLRGNLKNLEASSRSFAAEVYNLNKEMLDIDALLYKYDELNSKINKTSEDLEEMKEIIRQIQDLGGEDVSFFSALEPGKLNLEAVQEHLDALEKAKDEKTADAIENARLALESRSWDFSDLGEMTKEFVLLGEAMKFAKADSESAFRGMSKEAQDYATSMAKSLGKARNEKQRQDVQVIRKHTAGGRIIETPDTIKAWVPKINEQEIQEVQDKISQEVFNAWNSADLEGRKAMLIELNKGLNESQKGLVAETLEGANAITEIQKIFGSQADLMLNRMGDDIDAYDNLMNKLSGLNLDQDVIDTLIKNIVLEGPIEAFNRLTYSASNFGLTLKEVIKIGHNLNDMEFGNLNVVEDVTRLKGMASELQKVHDMMNGIADFDIGALRKAVETYPQLAEQIAKSGTLKTDGIANAMKEEENAAIRSLELENIQLQNHIDIWELQLKQYQKILANQNYLNQMTVEMAADLQAAGIDTMLRDFEAFEDAKTNYAATQAAVRARQEVLVAEGLSKNEALAEAYAEIGGKGLVIPTIKGGSGVTAAAKTARDIFQAEANNLQALINQNKAFMAINLKAMDKIKDKTLYGQSQKDAKEYEAKLNEIYVIMQKLAVLEEYMAQARRDEESAKTGDDLVQAWLDQNAIMEKQIKTLGELTAAQERAKDSLYSSLAPALKNAVEIIDGRLVPITGRYNRLSGAQKEAIDNVVESYNDLSDEINNNTQQIFDNTRAIEENNEKLVDAVIDGQKKVLEAYKNSEKKKLDFLKKTIEEEKKLLNQRKKLYEDAFKEEDHQNELGDIDSERGSIIEQLAQLEGATDLASVKRREELLKKKAELDNQYNTKVRDYNRTALLESIDAEIEAQDKKATAAEEAYEKLINDTEFVQAEVERIMNGGVDSVVEYLKEHLPEYSTAFSLEKTKIENEWTKIISTAQTAKTAIENNLPSMSPLLDQLNEVLKKYQEVVTGVPQATTSGSGTKTTTTSRTPAPKKVVSVTKQQVDTGQTMVQGSNTFKKMAEYEVTKYSDGSESRKLLRYYPGSYVSAPTTNTAIGRNTATIQQFSAGGEADFTGVAWLDGTKKRPERVLSPVQTELFNQMVKNLEEKNKKGGNMYEESITIGSLHITTNSLNNNQDFEEAGKVLGKAFKNAINERGINVNKKK